MDESETPNKLAQETMSAKASYEDSQEKPHDIELITSKSASNEMKSPEGSVNSLRQKLFKGRKNFVPRSPSKSAQILNKYKRMNLKSAIYCAAPQAKHTTIIKPAALQSTSIDNMLGKFGTTIKMVKATSLNRSFPVMINDEPEIEVPMKPALDPLKSRASVRKHQGFLRFSPPVQTLSKKPKLNPQLARKLLRKAPKSGENELCYTLKFPATKSTLSFNPRKSSSMCSKVTLQKNADGKYVIVHTPILRQPVSFPKAITYPNYELQKEKPLVEQSPSTSSASLPMPQAIVRPKIALQAEQQQEKIADLPSFEEQFAFASDDDEPDEPIASTNPLRIRPIHELQQRRIPSPEPEPLPVKYIIPQDMLYSEDDKIKNVVKQPMQRRHSLSPETNTSELFVFEMEEKPVDAFQTSKNRRKSMLVPKEDDQETLFEEPPFVIPPRPVANVDLIDNLAGYRVLVQNILKKLDMPKIDFNEDGDEYINLYKFYRN